MAGPTDYGLKALVAASKVCKDPDCSCTSNVEQMLLKVNEVLGPSHQLDEATYRAIRLDLDQNPISDRPHTNAGEKKRDDGNFERVVMEAFKAFRDQEREITLNPPNGSTVGCRHSTRTDENSETKFWIGGAHLRHHLEFLLVLKEVKPCVYFFKYAPENHRLFTSVVVNCLIPVMDQFDLWSYGFGISSQSGEWVFYDCRSTKMPLITKAFLTHPKVKDMNPAAYPNEDYPGTPDHETAEALGYPIPFDDWRSGRFVTLRDATEFDVLAEAGWPEDQRCCVQGMAFTCPLGDESVWKKAIDYYRQCQEAVKSVGTELVLFTGEYPEMTAWLEENPGMRDGIDWVGGAPSMANARPSLDELVEAMKRGELDSMDDEDLDRLMVALTFELLRRDQEGEGEDGEGEGEDGDGLS